MYMHSLKMKNSLGKIAFVGIAGLAFQAALADTITNTTSFEYDSVTGLLIAVVREPDDPQFHLRTQYAYDAFGNRTTTTVSSNASGTGAIAPRVVESITYDPQGGTPTSVRNALNQKYDLGVNPANLPVYIDSLNGLRSAFEYDSQGRRIKETRPDGNVTKWEYTLCSTVSTCVAGAKYTVLASPFASNGYSVNGAWVLTHYDGFDRVLRTETLGFNGVSIIRQDNEYDYLGRLYRVSRPYYANAAVYWTTYSYDKLNRVTWVSYPNGSTRSTSYNGLTTTETNQLYQTRQTIRDAWGQVVQIIDHQNNSLQYKYNANGNLVRTTDPKSNVVSMTYDAIGRKTAMVDPDLGSWTYAYDALGALKQQTDSKGQSTTMTYDTLGRMVSRAEPGLVSNWTYDCYMGIGKVCNRTADNGYSSSQSYDYLSRANTSTTTIDTSYSSVNDYDTNGRLMTQRYPTGLAVRYLYNWYGYLTEIRNYSTDELYWKADTRDADGHLLQQTFGNGVVTQQTFNAATGLLSSVTAGAGNAVHSLSFTYDARGNMLTRADANQNLSESFLYDSLNRLTSNTVNSNGAGVTTQTYAYDSIGNITSRSGVGTYTYGSTNSKPHAVTSIALTGGGSRQYLYDGVGNLVEEIQRDGSNSVIPAKGLTASYNSFNLPISMANPAATLTFMYGTEHQRIKQISPSGTSIYLHPNNAGGLFYEKEAKLDGTIVHKHFLTVDANVFAVVQQTGGATNLQYFHRDSLGSTTAITDANGSVIERFSYEPYGKRRQLSGSPDVNSTIVGANTDRGFTNHEHLEELQLVHMNGRIYDPAVAVFITADPTITDGNNLQSYNRYGYLYRNPLIGTDPTGFAVRSACVSSVDSKGVENKTCEYLDDGQDENSDSGKFGFDPRPFEPNMEGGGGGGGEGPAPDAPPKAPVTKKCVGLARVMKGNARLMGLSGGFNGSPPNLRLYGITNHSAAIIPSQFGMGKGSLRPNIGNIYGTMSNGEGFDRVRDIMDDQKVRQQMGINTTTAEFQQMIISRETVNNGGIVPFIVEVQGIAKDLGMIQLTLTIPAGMDCPVGLK
jgi:RHS repeat-associated protein